MIRSLALSPDGALVAYSTGDEKLRIRELDKSAPPRSEP
jgi:hypothetical protein